MEKKLYATFYYQDGEHDGWYIDSEHTNKFNLLNDIYSTERLILYIKGKDEYRILMINNLSSVKISDRPDYLVYSKNYDVATIVDLK